MRSRKVGIDAAQAQLVPNPVDTVSFRLTGTDEAFGETVVALPSPVRAFGQNGFYRRGVKTPGGELALEFEPAVLAPRQEPQANRAGGFERVFGFVQNPLSSTTERSRDTACFSPASAFSRTAASMAAATSGCSLR